jgi:hypothetical protein
MGVVKKRMAKGTKMPNVPAVDTFMFDCSKGDFIDPDMIAAAVKAEGNVDEEAEATNEGERA